MNLVKILSHEEQYLREAKEENKHGSESKVPVEAHALTIKEDCVESLLDICSQVRPEGFLDFDPEHSAMFFQDTKELVVITDEN